MAKKRRREQKPKPLPDVRATVAAVALGVVLAGTALVVDTAAGAAFDAPKRLVASIGIALAAAAAFATGEDSDDARSWRQDPPARRAALLFAAAALLGALLSALASPRRPVSLDTMRSVALFALLLPLGASRAVEKGRRWLAGVFIASTAVNASVSILQSRGLFHPFRLETFGGRQDTGAYAGGVGYLAITLALAAVLALGLLLTAAGRPAVRWLAGGSLALFAVALVVNRNLTAITAAVAGAGALLVVLYRKRAAWPLAATLLAAALAIAAYAPLRQRSLELAQAFRTGNWDALLSFRGGPWAAALEMTRERPLAGFGPGTFGAEYVPHRLAAEIRARRRFLTPLLTSSYGETHCDYLQAFCDAGVPVGLLVIGAGACLLAAVGRMAWSKRGGEAALLLAVLATGAAAALTWFPFQRPITAVPLLLAAGRAWRISGKSPSAEDTA